MLGNSINVTLGSGLIYYGLATSGAVFSAPIAIAAGAAILSANYINLENYYGLDTFYKVHGTILNTYKTIAGPFLSKYSEIGFYCMANISRDLSEILNSKEAKIEFTNQLSGSQIFDQANNKISYYKDYYTLSNEEKNYMTTYKYITKSLDADANISYSISEILLCASIITGNPLLAILSGINLASVKNYEGKELGVNYLDFLNLVGNVVEFIVDSSVGILGYLDGAKETFSSFFSSNINETNNDQEEICLIDDIKEEQDDSKEICLVDDEQQYYTHEDETCSLENVTDTIFEAPEEECECNLYGVVNTVELNIILAG